MKFSRTTLSLAVVILAFGAAGCGEPAEEATLGSMVDEAAADVQDTAETASGQAAEAVDDGAAAMEEAAGTAMDGAAEMADPVKGALAGKEAELAEVTAQIKQLSPQDLTGDKGKDLKAKADSLMAEIEKLKAE